MVMEKSHIKPVFRGVATALVTPFDDSGGIDYGALESIIKRQLSANVDALVINGTTGEASALTRQERCDNIAFAADIIKGKVPLIAGTGSNCTATAVKFTVDAAKSGADAVLSVVPYYSKATQEGLIKHFYAVADASNLPVIIYNVPSRTGMKLTYRCVEKLFRHKNIRAIKQSETNMSENMSLIARLPRGKSIYSGNDEMTLSILSAGGEGVISVASNAFPRVIKRMCDAFFRGDMRLGARLQKDTALLSEQLFRVVNPVPIKALMSYLGVCKNVVRLPLTTMRYGECKKLFSVAERLAEREAECAL